MTYALKRNLFDFATKELSQDAYLRWLFENWNCDDASIREACNLLIVDFLNVKTSVVISSLKTRAQYKRIDILIECTVDKKDYVVAIEDKIYSDDHSNQLAEYKETVVKDFPNINHAFIFYKTGLVMAPDIKRIEKQGWKVYDIIHIHRLYTRMHKSPNSDIFNDYVDKTIRTYKELCLEIPKLISAWEKTAVMNYVVNFCHNYISASEGVTVKHYNFRGNYIALQVFIKGKEAEIPYLEITSRDIAQRKPVFLILIHEVKISGIDPSQAHIKKWTERVASSKLFKATNRSKQLGKNFNFKEKMQTVEDLKEKFHLYMDEYYRIFKDS